MNIIEQNSESIYEISYSKEYKQELKNIYYYIAFHLQEENIAKKMIVRIKNKISDLEYMPRKFKLLKQYKEIEIRLLIVKNYIIIYQIVENYKSFIKLIAKLKEFTFYIFFIQKEIT